jgi:Immunity protein 53
MFAAMNTLTRLQDWYSRQCNGEWEHAYGISIQSCDNPGWWVKINLVGTPLETRLFTEIAEGMDVKRFAQLPHWMSCRIVDGVWHGAGDEARLERILEIFLAWAESNGNKDVEDDNGK